MRDSRNVSYVSVAGVGMQGRPDGHGKESSFDHDAASRDRRTVESSSLAISSYRG